jgi:hypothetical protein
MMFTQVVISGEADAQVTGNIRHLSNLKQRGVHRALPIRFPETVFFA